MKKEHRVWAITALAIAAPIAFIYLTMSNSIDCNQFVIDGYELHSGINIPEVAFINCYHDEAVNTRISVYQLIGAIDMSEFTLTEMTPDRLNGLFLLDETERPNETQVYLASGERWGTD